MEKILKLIKKPRTFLPFIRSRINPHKRAIFEFFKSDKYSKPYIGHKELLKYINKNNGFFVQCGGNDGYGSDPTYYLEKFKGWRGIIVEPLPISKICQKNRKGSKVISSACVPFDYTGDTVKFIDCFSMSFIKGSRDDNDEWIKSGEESQNIKSKEITVPAQTIQSIIDKHFDNKLIDLFVADVEGYELEVLKGLDFNKNSPTFFLLEARDPDKLTNFLEQFNYKLIAEVGKNNHLYKKNI